MKGSRTAYLAIGIGLLCLCAVLVPLVGHVRNGSSSALREAMDPISVTSGETPLMRASLRGDAQTVEHLIAQGADVNARSSEGNTALHAAIAAQRDAVVQLLIAKGADVNQVEIGGLRPLIEASSLGRADYVEPLLAAGADVNAKDPKGNTALSWTCQGGGSLALVKLLVTRGAKVDIITHPEEMTPLMFAAQASNPDVIEYLVGAGADLEKVDLQGWTPLDCAALMDRPDNIRMLVKLGARVNAQNKNGVTALMMIAHSAGRVKAMRALIDSGADVNTLDAEKVAGVGNGMPAGQFEKSEMLRRAQSNTSPATK